MLLKKQTEWAQSAKRSISISRRNDKLPFGVERPASRSRAPERSSFAALMFLADRPASIKSRVAPFNSTEHSDAIRMEIVNATGMVVRYTVGVDPEARESVVVVIKGTFNLPCDGSDPVLAEQQIEPVMADEFTGEP